MKISVIILFATLQIVTHAVAQEDAISATDTTAPTADTTAVQVANPFELTLQPSSAVQSEMMGMDMASMDMDASSMGMAMMDGEPAVPDDELFRYRLRTAISQISDSESAADKAAILKYTQTALQDQYDLMIARRKKDLERLKERLAMLEADLQKRAAAKDRVVKLQMQSVILAAEGLLDLNSLQSQPSSNEYRMREQTFTRPRKSPQ